MQIAGKLVLTLVQMFALLNCGCGLLGKDSKFSTVEVVSDVDINRYMGTWYEIARYPNRFQKDCLSSTATYSLRDDGKIDVVNRCTRKDNVEKTKEAHGKAWIVDPEIKGKLKVSFFWPFSGDYWIINLAPDYSYVVVGHPERKYLWIMARKPVIEKEIYDRIIEDIVRQEYSPEKLIVSPSQADYLNSKLE